MPPSPAVWKVERGAPFLSTLYLEDHLHLHKIMAAAHLLRNHLRTTSHWNVASSGLVST